ncbi:conserved hypothetical protein [delta proteobacterium NaphS2]|nr:conserved hypothetical protein [delta proteobacterium NaphS2]
MAKHAQNDCLLHILCHGVDMDAEKAIKEFQKRKVVTIEEIADLLDSSVTTARRQLKKWWTYTSFNMNGRYYSLPGIPRFDEHGIWKYREILFSQYGNLMQTISQLIERSETGLNARQIAQLVEIVPNSSVFSRLQHAPGIRREKHQGRFVYFSEEKYQEQKSGLSRPHLGISSSQIPSLFIPLLENNLSSPNEPTIFWSAFSGISKENTAKKQGQFL